MANKETPPKGKRSKKKSTKAPSRGKAKASKGAKQSELETHLLAQGKAPKKRKKKKPNPAQQPATMVQPSKKTRKPSPQARQSATRWRRADRLLTLAFVALLGLAVLGVVGLNAWSSQRSKVEFHPLSLSHLKPRLEAFVMYVKLRWGPPQAAASLGYEREIQQAALRHKLAPNLLKAVMRVESEFSPLLMGETGAVGLMQISPPNARAVGFAGNTYRPKTNIRAGAAFLHRLQNKHGTLPAALAQYHRANHLLPRKDPRVAKYVQRVLAQAALFQRDPGQEIRRTSFRNKRKHKKKWRLLKKLAVLKKHLPWRKKPQARTRTKHR